MARIRWQGVNSDSLIPTPPTGKATVYYNSTDRLMKAKLDNGSVISLTTTSELIEDTVANFFQDSTSINVTYDDVGNIISTEVIQSALDHTQFQNIGTNTHNQIDDHLASTTNPHNTTKAQVGLGNADNTSDLNKPISTATQTALDLKYDASNPSGYQTAAQVSTAVNAHASLTNNPHAVTKAQVGLGNADNTSDVNKPISTATQTALDLKEDKANKGVANGYVPLDSNTLIPTIFIPGAIDDVLEYASFAALPVTGTSGKLYVTIDDGKVFRWSGSIYVEVSGSPGSTDAVVEGIINLYFTEARVLATILAGLSVATNAAITASDSVLSAFGKLQAQITNILSIKADKTTTISAGTGLSGGGDLSANRTISMPNVGTAGTVGATNSTLSITTDTQGRVSAVTANAISIVSSQVTDFAATVRSVTLAGLALVTSTAITAADSVLVAFGKLQAQITSLTTVVNGKEPTITATTAADYYRGDKTFQPLNKAAVGLANVDNTSDVDKPISTATQNALDLKYDASNPNGYETPAQLNARDSANRDRANHTGTQLAATISDFAATVRATVLTGISFATNSAILATDTVLAAFGKLQAQLNGHFGTGGTTHPDATTSVSGFMSGADKTKLDGISGTRIIKSGTIAAASFTGLPRTATVTFGTAFPNTNYSITVLGANSRTWNFQAKAAGSFVINSNSFTALTGEVTWQCISHGETVE